MADTEDERAAEEARLHASLANERTLLAWNRTALALAGTGAIVLKLVPSIAPRSDHTIMGIAILAMAALTWLSGYARNRKQARAGRPVETARALRRFSFGMMVITGAALVLSLLPGRG